MTDEVTLAIAARDRRIKELEAERDELARQVGVLTTDDKGWKLFCLDNALQAVKAANKLTNECLSEFRAALIDAVDSLEYVQSAFTGATGYGVRAERIKQAREALAMLDRRPDRPAELLPPIPDEKLRAAHESDPMDAPCGVWPATGGEEPLPSTEPHFDGKPVPDGATHYCLYTKNFYKRDQDGMWFEWLRLSKFWADCGYPGEASIGVMVEVQP